MIRWGVVGPGSIATGFAEAMQQTGDGTIVAVASRSAERAAAFGDEFAIPTRYGDCESLAADPDVDIVYVATPHSCHEPDTLNLLRAAKHVLCEKPFALNAQQASRMVAEARARGLFLMEAIWSK
jgi:predicted dehydrogenase